LAAALMNTFLTVLAQVFIEATAASAIRRSSSVFRHVLAGFVPHETTKQVFHLKRSLFVGALFQLQTR
jgi:hypothetical protein